MINLSIIIPHYNSPDLLGKLLDSIPDRRDIEVIVVDDNSDKDIEKLDKIIDNYPSDNVMFFKNYKANKGAGACRNIGLENANGKWLLFADADDFFLEGFYEIISQYFNSDYEVVFFTPTSIYLDTGEKANRHKYYKSLIDDFLEKPNKKNELKLRYTFSSPCSKLLKNEFIKKLDIEFDEVIASNDVMFSTKTGYYMEQFLISKKIIYCITRNKGSLTVDLSEKIFDARLEVFIDHYKFLEKKIKKSNLNKLKISGINILIKSFNYGIFKLFSVYKKLKINNIDIITSEFLNPFFIFSKIFSYIKRKLKNIKYYIK